MTDEETIVDPEMEIAKEKFRNALGMDPQEDHRKLLRNVKSAFLNSDEDYAVMAWSLVMLAESKIYHGHDPESIVAQIDRPYSELLKTTARIWYMTRSMTFELEKIKVREPDHIDFAIHDMKQLKRVTDWSVKDNSYNDCFQMQVIINDYVYFMHQTQATPVYDILAEIYQRDTDAYYDVMQIFHYRRIRLESLKDRKPEIRYQEAKEMLRDSNIIGRKLPSDLPSIPDIIPRAKYLARLSHYVYICMIGEVMCGASIDEAREMYDDPKSEFWKEVFFWHWDSVVAEGKIKMKRRFRKLIMDTCEEFFQNGQEILDTKPTKENRKGYMHLAMLQIMYVTYRCQYMGKTESEVLEALANPSTTDWIVLVRQFNTRIFNRRFGNHDKETAFIMEVMEANQEKFMQELEQSKQDQGESS